MMEDFGAWLVSVVASSGVIGLAALLMRETLARYFAKAVEHRFDQRLEDFKTVIRVKEQELDQMRSFLLSARREREGAVQAKRFQAAEQLLGARTALSQFTMLAEYLKILDVAKVLDSNDPKVWELMASLAEPFKIDENLKVFSSVDKTLPRLYLSERCLKAYDAYEAVISHAVMLMKVLVLPLPDKSSLLKSGYVSAKVIEVAPSSKEGFEKWGDTHAFSWTGYLHDEILRMLRAEVSGEADALRDARSIAEMAVQSRQAQVNVLASMAALGISGDLLSEQAKAAHDSIKDETNAPVAAEWVP